MFEERKIIITMNPAQLRKLADKMEKKYINLDIGDNTFVDFLGQSPSLTVCLHMDQHWFEKNTDLLRSELLPEPTKEDVSEYRFEMSDIVIYKWSHKMRSAYADSVPGIRVKHIPTGTEATCGDYNSRHKNRAEALKKLDKLIRKDYL